MTDKVKISCGIDTTDPACPLGLQIWLDDMLIFDQTHISEATRFEHEIDDDGQPHSLRFTMSGKTSEHTKIDANGQIITDARLILKDLEFDQMALGNMFYNLATYTHDFNGTQNSIVDQFFGEMGCNGTVELKFSAPVYLWLLENM